MNTLNFNHWDYEMTRERQRRLLEIAEQERLLRTVEPAAKRPRHWLQRLARLRTWRLVTPRLYWSSPVDEASCTLREQV